MYIYIYRERERCSGLTVRCIYIYIYIHIPTYIHTHTYIHALHTYTHIHTYIHTYVRTYIHTFALPSDLRRRWVLFEQHGKLVARAGQASAELCGTSCASLRENKRGRRGTYIHTCIHTGGQRPDGGRRRRDQQGQGYSIL